MKKRILVVEDEENIRKVIKKLLEINEFEVFEAKNGSEAIEKFYEEKLDLIILDWMLPKLTGIEVLEIIRKESRIPILMLTAKTQEDDEVKSLEVGASDYLRKPFGIKVLLTRVKKLLNLIGTKKKYGKLELDYNLRKVLIDEKDCNVSPKEFDLLNYMILNKGISISREKMLTDLWDMAYEGDYRTVDTHIKTLRKKIGAEYIITVRGIGYKFDVIER